MPALSLITCTGGRPEAFAILERCVRLQEISVDVDFEWFVVDDSEPATPLRCGQVRVPPAALASSGRCTLAENFHAAVSAASGDAIIVIEDDEHYLPLHIDRMLRELESADLAGEAPARYYPVPTRRWRQYRNPRHASLCQTGFTRKIVPRVLKAVSAESTPFLDLSLWKLPVKKLVFQGKNAVRMKGMPGRPGIGVGHQPDSTGWKRDTSGSQLRKWLGAGRASWYESFRL